jgi:uncharacterized protein YjbJ (UPF0337 family)
MKNATDLSESWSKTKEKLKQKFAMLTDGDVLFVENENDKMLSRLQAKLGKTKEEIKNIIAKLYLNEQDHNCRLLPDNLIH